MGSIFTVVGRNSDRVGFGVGRDFAIQSQKVFGNTAHLEKQLLWQSRVLNRSRRLQLAKIVLVLA